MNTERCVRTQDSRLAGAGERICYWKAASGVFYLYLPGAGIGSLANHTVTEHNDGTITVSPSILQRRVGNTGLVRHGFITEGVWHPCPDDKRPR
jgi:hypothetical protein